MKKLITASLLIVVLAVFLSSCMSSRGAWSDCPSHDKNYFKPKGR